MAGWLAWQKVCVCCKGGMHGKGGHAWQEGGMHDGGGMHVWTVCILLECILFFCKFIFKHTCKIYLKLFARSCFYDPIKTIKNSYFIDKSNTLDAINYIVINKAYT